MKALTNLLQAVFNPFVLVCLFGAIGASLGYFSGFANSATLSQSWDFQLYIAAPLGALASAIFIFLFANTDRSDRPRLFVLSALAGFFWQPVIDSGGVYINQIAQAETQKEVREIIEKLKESEKFLESGASAEAAIQTINEIVSQVTSLDTSHLKLNDIKALNAAYLEFESRPEVDRNLDILANGFSNIDDTLGELILKNSILQAANAERFGVSPDSVGRVSPQTGVIVLARETANSITYPTRATRSTSPSPRPAPPRVPAPAAKPRLSIGGSGVLR